MLFSLAWRILSSAAAFVYPTYASYKSLSQRPASAEDLERWLMYWSVLGVIMAVEYVGEWAISWIPFYWTIKTCLLLWLALPQTQGSTYLYRSRLAPLLTTYEPTIDSYLSQYKAKLYTVLQEKLRSLWDAITEVIAKQTGVQLNAQNPSASPTAAAAGTDDGKAAAAGGGAAVVLGLWKAWGPAVAGALAPLQERAQRAVAEAAAAREAAAKPRPQAPSTTTRPLAFPLSTKGSSLSDTASIAARRRQLEAELAALAALPNISVSSVQDDSERETTPTPPDLANISNLAHSVYLSDSAEVSESESLATGTGARGRFEEITKDEFGDDSEDAAEPPTGNRTSWFGGWGRRSSGYSYQPVKTD